MEAEQQLLQLLSRVLLCYASEPVKKLVQTLLTGTSRQGKLDDMLFKHV